jgi:hypothetical protein
MATSTKEQDRRAVIEQMRKDQKATERRRTLIVVVACVIVAAAIITPAALTLFKQKQTTDGPLATIGASGSAAGCQDIVKKHANGNQDHKPMGTNIFYPEAPPAFGPHWPVPADFSRHFYTTAERPEIEQLVHNEEHGYNILWYDAAVAGNADELAQVKAIAAKFEGQKLTDKFIAAPWTSKDGKPFPNGAHVALTHWSVGGDPTGKSQQGIWQYCGKPSGDVVDQFVKDYPYSDSPEPQAM